MGLLVLVLMPNDQLLELPRFSLLCLFSGDDLNPPHGWHHIPTTPARRIGTVGKKDSVETLSLFNFQNLSLMMWSVHGPFTSESPGEFITNDVQIQSRLLRAAINAKIQCNVFKHQEKMTIRLELKIPLTVFIQNKDAIKTLSDKQ